MDADKFRIKAEKYIKTCLAGPAAEMKFTGKKKSSLGMNDYEQAFSVCLNLDGWVNITNLHISYLHAEVESLFTYTKEAGSDINHTPGWDEVRILAKALIEKKTLRFAQVNEILSYFTEV